MAIKVNGTTVIDDSRNFSNIAGGFKTVNGTSVVGSGDISAGASTTYADVGTYVIAGILSTTLRTGGFTTAGSNLLTYDNGSNAFPVSSVIGSTSQVSAGLSGTWRLMAARLRYSTGSTSAVSGLWVRIS